MKRDYGVSLPKKQQEMLSKKKTVKTLTVTQSCVFLNISRQAYYKQCRCALEKKQLNEKVIHFIRAKRMQYPRMGRRKLLYFMKQNKALSSVVGRDKLFLLIREARLLVPCRRAYHKTTQSNHHFWCHPNLNKPSADQVIVNRSKQVGWPISPICLCKKGKPTLV